MTKVKEHPAGTFCWVDLSTSDVAGAKKFYSSFFGWAHEDVPAGPGMTYTLLNLAGNGVGAMTPLMPEQAAQGVPPHWNCYVRVMNVADTTSTAAKLGATVVMPPMDVMQHGRMSVIQDPTGAYLCLWEPLAHQGAGVVNEAGAMCWHELMTTDLAKATTFYTQLFGWKTKEMEMATGKYIVGLAGEQQAGGMMAITKEMGPMPSCWGVYFAVDDCDAACAKAQQLGAKICMPAFDIPNVGRMAAIQDPQGAAFMIIKLNMPG